MKYENLANNLKLYRKKAGLTQKELGQKILKSEISIRKYESGNVNIPPSTLLDICEVLGTNVGSLLGYDSKIYAKNNLDAVAEESILIAKDSANVALDWINKVENIHNNPKYLLDAILNYLKNTEQYHSSILVNLIDENNKDLPYFTDEQINEIVEKVTHIVKYEIYRIEESMK